MAIVEDEVRNESEEENEIEVVVEEDDGDQDSDDSDEDDDDELLEHKVLDLERRVSEDPNNYELHIDLIQALWSLQELDRWRTAFEHLQELQLLKPEHWLQRIETEQSLAHTEEAHASVAQLFHQATLDCYSVPVLSAWCSWSVGLPPESARAQFADVLRCAGADPLSGKIFWDAKCEVEKMYLTAMCDTDPEYKAQKERILWCFEESVSRPLLRGEDAWPDFQELALELKDQEYIDKVKIQHDAATEYLKKTSTFEDRLLAIEIAEEKFKVYEEYIETVKELAEDDKYAECDSNGILKVLYDRMSSECSICSGVGGALRAWARLARRGSRAGYARVLDACVRRAPRVHAFWTLKMQHAEHQEKPFLEIKTIFEKALSRSMESYKEAESLWLSYLEYIRRITSFDSESDLDRLRRTFRLAWDSLAEAWAEEANDCEIPLFWARLEYKRMNNPKQGKEIFEEIFKYGENKTLSKYWEALLSLESNRSPGGSAHKLRELHRRALRNVHDYPPGVARAWTDAERDHGDLHSLTECQEECEKKIKEWRESYQAMKDKMTSQKQKNKPLGKKTKFDNKKTETRSNKGKRKSEERQSIETKKKRTEDMDMDVKEKERDSGGGGVKRSHVGDEIEATDSKRQRREDGGEGSRDESTLFVSNLEFKVDEIKLREKLSEFGEIVSLRVRAGVKAFGGSICYCQYTNAESVMKALKHDRMPLDGRPMFFSQYSAKKGGKMFKYAMTTEPNKLFVRNLPYECCTPDALGDIFNEYGKNDIRIVTYKDGKPKGLAYVEYEEAASAAAAIEKTNGREVGGRRLEVAVSAPPPRADAALGQPKRDTTGGMRRTQLSSFIPSVLQKASTSKAAPAVSNGNHSNGDKRPLSNNDFRSLLLNKK